MLGKYDMSGLGANPLDTIKQTLRTTEDVLPAVEIMAEDYAKASPLVNFMIDYWAVALLGLSLVVAGGASVGSWIVLKRLEKRR